MKKFIKYISILAVIISLASCESNEKSFPELELVPIYALTNIDGAGDMPISISVYRDEALMVEYIDALPRLLSFETTNFSDLSDATNYDLSFDKNIVVEQESGPDLIETIRYEIAADVVLGTGTLTTTKDNGDGTNTVQVYTIAIAKEQRYN
ncbi:hypothetical protein [Flavicella sediminum]|uniref:hypothetical protein n=1 Tax=Flavicella sediminum TaxID=2585141 RepID=UPI00112435D5|nr:hypothetical protein [Flavicella sediminum]